MLRLTVPLLVGIVVGFLAGILFQRFFPVGSILAQAGLRDLLPIPRRLPDGPHTLADRNWDVPTEDRGHLVLFVLMGQSNMSGRGKLDSPDVPVPHPQVYVFNKDYRWHLAHEPLGTVPEEVDWIATDGGTGVGPGLSFARSLLEHDPNLRIGLIPCARGTSTIQDWQPDLSQNSLYGSCLRRVNAASAYGKVAAILFSQGEAEATIPELPAGIWGSRFEAIVESMRADLSLPDLPVLFAQLGSFSGDPVPSNWEIVRKQQAGVRLPNVVMIKTDDLPLQPDIHFSTESNVEIGRRFAVEYLKISGRNLQ